MVHDKWSLQQVRDSNSRPLGHEPLLLPLDHDILPCMRVVSDFDVNYNCSKKNDKSHLSFKKTLTSLDDNMHL